MPRIDDVVAGVCASCGEPLSGRFCAQCGERVLEPDALTVRHFITHTIFGELTTVDGKLWRTLRNLMLHPGFLSSEYAAGRRNLYVNPVRLLLTAIVVYALMTQGGLLVTLMLGRVSLSIAPTAVPGSVSIAETIDRIDRFGVLQRMVAAKGPSIDITSDAARERFHRRLNQFAQPLSFANVLLLALALHVVFRHRRRLLVENAAFSMHLVSFVLFSSLAMLPGVRLLEVNETFALLVFLLVFVWQSVYIGVAVRRFYFGGATVRAPWLRAIVAALFIYLLNSVFITTVQMIGGAIALR